MTSAMVLTISLAAAAPLSGAELREPFRFLHDLSAANGRVDATSARLAWDPRSREVLVVAGGTVRVFNAGGMQVHSFGRDEELSAIAAITPLDESGDYAVLTGFGATTDIYRCDYRGALVSRIELSDLPPKLKDFVPRSIYFFENHLYLASEQDRVVVQIDLEGRFVRYQDLAPLLASEKGEDDEVGGGDASPDEVGIRGLSVDGRGNILFTVPTLFRAFVISPDGAVRSFGKKGSTGGKFNVVVAISTDEAGNAYVLDTLRSTVSLFDADFRFVQQFGFRSHRPGGLIAPTAVLVADGRVYVSQGLKRGIAVYARRPGLTRRD